MFWDSDDIVYEMAQQDVIRGDYVTLDRFNEGFLVYEHLKTFGGVDLYTARINYAGDAASEEGAKSIGQGDEAGRG